MGLTWTPESSLSAILFLITCCAIILWVWTAIRNDRDRMVIEALDDPAEPFIYQAVLSKEYGGAPVYSSDSFILTRTVARELDLTMNELDWECWAYGNPEWRNMSAARLAAIEAELEAGSS